MTPEANQILRELAETWTVALDQTLVAMIGQKPKVEWKIASAPEDANIFWWEQHLSLEQSPLIWVAAPAQSWNELGGRTLRAAGIETVEEADARNTYLEILNQSLAAVAQSMGHKLGVEVTCARGDAGEPPSVEVDWIAVEVSYDDTPLSLHLGFASRLVVRLGQPAAEPTPVPEITGSDPQPESPALAPHCSRTLDLLLDVELPVSVSFGRAELPLKDVLKLTTGSIVELNRGVSEPVEVIVNNCVVARGEVVVMDGNYGVRIHQIISPQERLRTLK